MSDPDFTRLKGAVSRKRTFSISLKDAFSECLRDTAFFNKIKSGNYIFVDSVFCLSHSKYFFWDATGKPGLTEYARKHLHECCIPFDATLRHAPKDKPKWGFSHEQHFRVWKYDPLYFEPHYSSDATDDSTREAMIKEYNDSMLSIMKTLPISFSGTLDALIKWTGMKEEELAEASDLSEKTIWRLRNSEPHNVSIETVIQLCIGMKLPPPLSSCLLKASGNTFTITAQHMMYQFLLGACYAKSIYECNYHLIAQGFKPLGKGGQK